MDPETAVAVEPSAFLVMGLGNPGPEYRDTRHNVGFSVVEELASRRHVGTWQEICGSLVARVDDLWLALPQTYMNRSGFAARCLLEREHFSPQSILVVVDDVHLELGRMRVRRRGSPGGHRGLESVMECLGTDQVPRLRLGVGQVEDGGDLVDHVLGHFLDHEMENLQEMVKEAADACEVWMKDGVDAAMNRFNA